MVVAGPFCRKSRRSVTVWRHRGTGKRKKIWLEYDGPLRGR